MRWIVKKNDSQLVKHLAKTCKLTELQANLLLNRGIKTEEEARKYLYGDLSDLYNPRLLKDMDKAVHILREAIKNQWLITILGDYDADGIDATATAFRGLKHLGAQVNFYLPNRLTEGYGMNMDAIRKLHEEGTKVLLTVDNGVASVEEVKLAKELGMKVVVTDHHNCPDILPEPDALVNPKRPGCVYPNKDLCGCSLIWRVLEVLYEDIGGDLDFIYSLLPFVAVATVADVMDLKDENRILVKEGLAAINARTNPGLNALMDLYKIEELKAEDIGFRIGPCLNADGRLSDAKKAVRLLCTDDNETARQLAKELYGMNEKRKEMTRVCYEKTEDYIRDKGLADSRFMVVFVPSIPEGLVGLVAGRIKEKYQVPTLVFTEGEEYFKASGRGVEGHPLDMYTAIQETKEYWVKGGGHPMACGISMEKNLKKLTEFREKLNLMADEYLKGSRFEPTLIIDAEVDIPDEKLCREIAILEPTGKANPKPLFATNSMNVEKAKPVGDGSHIAFDFDQGRKGIGFGKTHVYQSLKSPTRLKVAYCPMIDIWTYEDYSGKQITKRTVKMHITDLQGIHVGNKSLLISSLKQSVQSVK